MLPHCTYINLHHRYHNIPHAVPNILKILVLLFLLLCFLFKVCDDHHTVSTYYTSQTIIHPYLFTSLTNRTEQNQKGKKKEK